VMEKEKRKARERTRAMGILNLMETMKPPIPD